MPYAFTHIVFSWLLAKPFLFIKKRKLDNLGWFLLFFGAILPDIDYLVQWTILPGFHRTATHSLLALLTVFIISIIIFKILSKNNIINKNKSNLYIFLITFGFFTHLLLDFSAGGRAGIPIFWPNTDFYGINGVISYQNFIKFNFEDPTYLLGKIKWMVFDMGIGTAWLFYLIYKKKIKEF